MKRYFNVFTIKGMFLVFELNGNAAMNTVMKKECLLYEDVISTKELKII
jgi:hypothetical protein